MSFQKFVQRSTKGLFLFIAIMMIVPLVLWGYLGKSGPDKDPEESVGVIFDTVHITKREFAEQKSKAYPAYYWRVLRSFRGMRPPEPRPEDIVQQARRSLVLLQDAKDKGIPKATQEEMHRKLQEIWFNFTGGRMPLNAQNEELLAKSVFKCSVPTFEAWLEDQVVIDKLFSLVAGAEFAEYDKVYDRLMGEQQSVRVTFAAIDPADYVKEVKPPRTEEIAKYYEANKTKFHLPEKARFEYLMADIEELKKKAPEPGEDEQKKYYEGHKSEFLKPVEHKHEPGHEHKDDEKMPDPEPKPFAEVQADVVEKIKRKWAEDLAFPVIEKISRELGEVFVTNNSKYPETVLDEMKSKHPEVALSHDVTALFDTRRLEEVDKVLGSPRNFSYAWAFDAKNKAGDIAPTVVQTTKGNIILKLLEKRAPDENPGVTVQNRESIVKELQKEQLRKRVQLQASTIVDEIKVHGLAATRLKYPLEWRWTRYFKTDFSGDPGIEDRSLGSAIRSRVSQGKVKAGESFVLQGSMMGREKQDWSYVLYVDDVVNAPPDDLEARFQDVRREMDGSLREQFQENYANQMVFRANIRGLEAKDGAIPTPAAPVHEEDNP